MVGECKNQLNNYLIKLIILRNFLLTELFRDLIT